MKYQTLFSGKKKKYVTNLWSAEFAQRMLKVNNSWYVYHKISRRQIVIFFFSFLFFFLFFSFLFSFLLMGRF